MKKNGTAYGLFEGQMYPFACCSWTNSSSAFCSSCVSWYTFPGIEEGAPGFSSIASSQMWGSVNLWEASLLNTDRWQWYLAGIFLSPICDPACLANFDASVCFLFDEVGMDTWVMCIDSVMGGICQSGFLWPAGVAVHDAIQDSMAFLVCRMSGSWVLLIHPLAQSIFGWLAANHGYPRMTFWSARSVRKNHNHTLWFPVCISRSV